MLTYKQIAEYLGIHEGTAAKVVAIHEFPTYKEGRKTPTYVDIDEKDLAGILEDKNNGIAISSDRPALIPESIQNLNLKQLLDLVDGLDRSKPKVTSEPSKTNLSKWMRE